MPNPLTKLLDASTFPAVCHLTIYRRKIGFNASPKTGSGALISPRHVLTAAHNAVSWVGNTVRFIDVRVGMATADESGSHVRSKHIHIPAGYVGWFGRTNFNFDYALIELVNPVIVENYPALATSLPAQGEIVRVIGYPGDEKENPAFTGRDLFHGHGEVLKLLGGKRQLSYDVDTSTGLSGGAIVNEAGEIVAVHTRSAQGHAPGGGRLLDDRALSWIEERRR